MGVAERKTRERAERESRITEADRAIAEAEGWPAVTVRRLAEVIEYSQPVLYSHFAGRDAIVAAVAVQGFGDLARALRRAAEAACDRARARRAAAEAYLAFARERPALYEAMFTLPSALRFAQADIPAEARAAFAALAAVAAPAAHDGGAATETFWATLHGLAELERSGRIRPGARDERLALVVDAFSGP